MNNIHVLNSLQYSVLSTRATPDYLFVLLLVIILLIISALSYKYKNSIKSKQGIISIILLLLTGVTIGAYAYLNLGSNEINISEFVGITVGTSPFRLIISVITLVTTYIGTLALDSVTQKMVEEDGRQVVDEHRREVIFRILQLILYSFVLIALLNYWNVDIRSILIGAGALAAIIGLSARHTLSAALAGIVLLFSRPFKVGDWIEVGDNEGTVRRITIVNTILHTPNDEQVVIPNDVISEKTIKNKNNTNKLRIPINVEIAYNDDVNEVLQIAEQTVKKSDIVADVPEPKAHIEEFGESGVKIRIFIWIKRPTPRRRTVAKATGYKRIKESFDNEKITIPYPRRKIDLSQELEKNTMDSRPDNNDSRSHNDQSEDKIVIDDPEK